MIYGRVIGNELRDVPPECLPIWGQRWSGYRVPHGPSPFSTRIFSADRMSEVGPALTSHAQFEETLSEVDEAEDTASESSRLCTSFPSSPLAMQTDAAELTFRPETPTPRSVHRSSSHLHGSPKMLRRSGHLPPRDATPFDTTSFSNQQLEQSCTQPHMSEHLLYPPASYHGILNQDFRGPSENDHGSWDMDCTSTGIQLGTGPSHESHVARGQLQHTMAPYSILEWQFANTHAQSSAYPFQPVRSSYSGSGCLLQPFQADDQTGFFPETPPSSSHCFTIPLPQQNVSIDPPWRHESNITTVLDTAHSRIPVVPQWPVGSVPPNPPLTGPLQIPGSPLSPGVHCHSASDYHRDPHSENLLNTLAHAEGCMLLSLDKPGDYQITR